jgi:hypothetical protein
MRRPLFPLRAQTPAQVWSWSYVQGSGALTTRGPSWSRDGVAACDEPGAFGVDLPASDAPPPAGDAPPAAGVAVPPVVAPPAANCDG